MDTYTIYYTDLKSTINKLKKIKKNQLYNFHIILINENINDYVKLQQKISKIQPF